MSPLNADHPGPSRRGHLVECTCTACGHVLQVACPHCAGTSPAAARAGEGLRADQVTALLVDAVISASAAEGTAYAARTLSENGVPFDVALRVLTRPASRRYHPVTQPHAAARRGAGAGAAQRAAHPVI
jgi:hypothetical protein